MRHPIDPFVVPNLYIALKIYKRFLDDDHEYIFVGAVKTRPRIHGDTTDVSLLSMDHQIV